MGAAIALPPVVPTPILSGADHLVPLTDGAAAFAAIGDALGQARRSIDLELYEFQRLDLAALLLDAQERGVTVTAGMGQPKRFGSPITLVILIGPHLQLRPSRYSTTRPRQNSAKS